MGDVLAAAFFSVLGTFLLVAHLVTRKRHSQAVIVALAGIFIPIAVPVLVLQFLSSGGGDGIGAALGREDGS